MNFLYLQLYGSGLSIRIDEESYTFKPIGASNIKTAALCNEKR